MPEQTRPDDKTMPTRARNMDPAEGSRETADTNAATGSGGITNRPLAEEQDSQDRVPPRGENKEGGHA